jgi:hypothetical protein
MNGLRLKEDLAKRYLLGNGLPKYSAINKKCLGKKSEEQGNF